MAQDILERVLTNDRADLPATVQRRHLADAVPPQKAAAQQLDSARFALDDARRQAAPTQRALAAADLAVYAAAEDVRQAESDHAAAPIWRRRQASTRVDNARTSLTSALAVQSETKTSAVPFETAVERAELDVRAAKQSVSRTDRIAKSLNPPTPTRSAVIEIDLPGM